MKKPLLILSLLIFAFSLFGQKAGQYHLPEPVQTVKLQKLDKQKLLEEDALASKGRLRCAILLPVDKKFPGEIEAEKIAGGNLYRFKIDAPEAEAVNLYLEEFKLPEGAELTFYNEDMSDISPIFSSYDNPDNGIFVTDHISGSSVIVELFCPESINTGKCFVIKEAGYMYRPLPSWKTNTKGFGGSGFCEVNINCPEGLEWQNAKRGVARILLVSGGSSYWCTGSLVNNVKKDRTPYFLTAEHCADGTSSSEFSRWKFYFNYESPTCENPQSDPVGSAFLTTGATKLSEGKYWGGSDFTLLLLDNKVSSEPNLFFNGWSLSPIAATNGVGIHHPDGDIKKISTFTSTLTSASTTHWRAYWAQTKTNWGVTEGGSSGSPLFNQSKLIVGTLTGGYSECSYQQGYDDYGKMIYHWDKNGSTANKQLQPWLDPDNTGVMTLQGLPSVPVGIESVMENKITVWPNPVETVLYIEMEQNREPATVKVTDISGRTIFHKQCSSTGNTFSIDFSQFQGGVYIVVLATSNSIKTQKIIKY